jgi:hypothetical protein
VLNLSQNKLCCLCARECVFSCNFCCIYIMLVVQLATTLQTSTSINKNLLLSSSSSSSFDDVANEANDDPSKDFSADNLLKTKRRLLYLNAQFVPRSKHFSPRLYSDKYKTYKYSVGRAYYCWMLNLLVHHVTSELYKVNGAGRDHEA